MLLPYYRFTKHKPEKALRLDERDRSHSTAQLLLTYKAKHKAEKAYRLDEIDLDIKDIFAPQCEKSV